MCSALGCEPSHKRGRPVSSRLTSPPSGKVRLTTCWPEGKKSPDWEEYRRFLQVGKVDVRSPLDKPGTDPPYLCPKCKKDVRRYVGFRLVCLSCNYPGDISSLSAPGHSKSSR
jgi:hypothetical protein